MAKYKHADAYFQDAATTIKSKIKTRIIEWRNDVNHFQEEVSAFKLCLGKHLIINVIVMIAGEHIDHAQGKHHKMPLKFTYSSPQIQCLLQFGSLH